jgi:hypothetical protein
MKGLVILLFVFLCMQMMLCVRLNESSGILRAEEEIDVIPFDMPYEDDQSVEDLVVEIHTPADTDDTLVAITDAEAEAIEVADEIADEQAEEGLETENTLLFPVEVYVSLEESVIADQFIEIELISDEELIALGLDPNDFDNALRELAYNILIL